MVWGKKQEDGENSTWLKIKSVNFTLPSWASHRLKMYMEREMSDVQDSFKKG